MTDKLITHSKALNIIENSFEEYIFLLEHAGLSINLIKKWKTELRDYVISNEQRDRDVARYFELENKYLLDTQTTEEMHERWALEEKLSKVGKKE